MLLPGSWIWVNIKTFLSNKINNMTFLEKYNLVKKSINQRIIQKSCKGYQKRAGVEGLV